MEAHNQRMKEARERVVSSASSDLVDVHSQSLPAGVPVHSMASDGDDDEMPELEPIEGEEEEQMEDDEEVEDDDVETQVPPQSRKHKEMIDYNNKIERWRQKDFISNAFKRNNFIKRTTRGNG